MTKFTLLDAIKLHNGGFDICDKTWDWGTYFESQEQPTKDMDGYDKVMYVFASNIEFIQFNKDWFSPCDVDGFIRKNISIFNKFLNETMQEDYTPKGFVKKYGKIDGEDFYDVYMTPFEHLINGNFAYEDYDRLIEIIREKKPSLLKGI